MNTKFLILLIIGFLSFRIMTAKDTLSNDYEFVNSIYKNHVNSNLAFYYLYYKPAFQQFTDPLKDTLSKYIPETDILQIKNQIEFPDTSFSWNQKYLKNCIVIQDNKVIELQSKNTRSSSVMIDGRTGKPVENEFNIDSIPIEERQFYYFSKPAWNLDKTLVVFRIHVNKGNQGENREYIYRKENNDWKLLTEMESLVWMQN